MICTFTTTPITEDTDNLGNVSLWLMFNSWIAEQEHGTWWSSEQQEFQHRLQSLSEYLLHPLHHDNHVNLCMAAAVVVQLHPTQTKRREFYKSIVKQVEWWRASISAMCYQSFLLDFSTSKQKHVNLLKY